GLLRRRGRVERVRMTSSPTTFVTQFLPRKPPKGRALAETPQLLDRVVDIGLVSGRRSDQARDRLAVLCDDDFLPARNPLEEHREVRFRFECTDGNHEPLRGKLVCYSGQNTPRSNRLPGARFQD